MTKFSKDICMDIKTDKFCVPKIWERKEPLVMNLILRVSNEYFIRTKKIWSSELSAHSKVIANNAFTVPSLMATIGVLDCFINEIMDIVIKTQKKY